VRDVVAELLGQLPPAAVSFAALFPRLVRELHDPVRVSIAHASPNMPPPKLDLWTAIGAEIRLLRLTPEDQYGSIDRALISHPNHLDAFYKAGRHAETPNPIFCEGLDSPDDVAREVRRCVQDGVEEEARIAAGRPTCGGGVEVAIIDATGARRWSPA
jgi:hypothetical protein